MKKRLIAPLFLLLLLTLALPAAAQEPIGTPIRPPDPPPWPTDGLRIPYQRVDVNVEGQVATTHIEQLFVNDNDWLLEGTYLFPLPAGAAVNQLTMWIDGAPIDAKILPADEARGIYDEIVRQLRDPALLEYVGNDAIQANVFPIPPGEERLVEIEYTHILPVENGLVRYVFPQSTDLYTNLPLGSQRIRVDVQSEEAIRATYSPSHSVAISRDGEHRATASFEASDVMPEQDFELFYTVSPDEIGLNLMSYKQPGEDGFFLLLVAPVMTVEPDEIVAKDVILVLDTSGSMEGEKLAQAKQAASYVIDHLNPVDRYNVISFSSAVRSLASELVPVSSTAGSTQFIESLQAAGGTNISLALLEAMAQADSERPTTIIFLTDGLATEGIVETPQLLDAVATAAPANVRLFAFGVGNDVDTVLLGGLAANHRGTTTYVRPGQAIDEAVSGFYAKVSTPVLANISLEVDGITVEQLYPAELPDLFAGTQLVVAGRYRQGGPAVITLEGEINGRPESFTYQDHVFRANGGDEFIPRLWATRAIGHLLQQIRLNGENEELVQSVVNLSVRFGIITPYTSYLIEEDDILTQTGRQIIVEEAMEERAMEPAPVSGAEAVGEAAMAADMAEAEAPMAPLPTQTAQTGIEGASAPNVALRVVGSKTFIQRDGLWTDTAYDPDQYEPQRVAFASNTYFDLLAAAPGIGDYLSLGPHVLFVYDGIAYEIVEDGESDAVTLPATNANEESDKEPTVSEATPQPADVGPSAATGDNAEGSALCLSALVLPLFVFGIFIRAKRR